MLVHVGSKFVSEHSPGKTACKEHYSVGSSKKSVDTLNRLVHQVLCVKPVSLSGYSIHDCGQQLDQT